MKLLASEQKRGVVKGFGLGLAAVTLIYAGLFGWAALNGVQVVNAREKKLVSSTVIIDRVLPMSQPVQRPAAVDEIAAHPVEVPETDIDAAVAPEKTGADENLQRDGIQRYANGMAIAPVDGLYDETPQGRLPAVRTDGLSPFKAYRKPFILDGNKPVISIAVMDIGLSDKLSEEAVKSLPPEVSLIASPYATAIETWVKDAHAAGHEVWLSLPMESSQYPRVDPGPHTLVVGAPERENQQKLAWVMSRATGYTGLVAMYQDVFMNAQNDARPVLGAVYKRGLGFIGNGGKGSLPQTMAESMNAPYSNVNVWIDKPGNTPETIGASLRQLEAIAREGGFAAGVISANSVSFHEVKAWLETLKDKGFVLAPLSSQTGM